MGIVIKEVKSRSELNRFIDFQYQLYKGNAFWAPPLRSEEFNTLSKEKNPVYRHADSNLILAYRDNRIVGRMAGLINETENQGSEDRKARFGWLDFEDDPEITKALFEATEKWARSKGCTLIKGPYGFSNMDKAGMLTFGFDELSTMASIYNFAYYPSHMYALGYEKLVDWKEFEATVPEFVPERVKKFAQLMKERYKLSEVSFKNKATRKIIGREIFQLINIAYNQLEGFVPFSDQQIEILVQKYLTFIKPDFLSIIRDPKGLAGFGISMPSFTKALQKANGRLFPFGIFHIRKALKSNDRADLYLIAVRPDLKGKGVTSIIFEKMISTFNDHGISRVETNPEMESNQQVQNLWKGYDMRLHKRRRCYQKNL